ncbi:hypothetical protein J9303_06820 [Bacillaceae bacterium Marseille-Q3522]|nr:hypothetical protein [Bacillaceae bacterium Marseille-Q3522]
MTRSVLAAANVASVSVVVVKSRVQHLVVQYLNDIQSLLFAQFISAN